MRLYFIDENALFFLGIVFLLFLVFGLFLSQGVPNGVASKGDTALLNNIWPNYKLHHHVCSMYKSRHDVVSGCNNVI